jgi:hypothetical protein
LRFIGCEGWEADWLTFPVAFGQTGRPKSRKLHDLVRKLRPAGGFALPERMQQKRAFRRLESP